MVNETPSYKDENLKSIINWLSNEKKDELLRMLKKDQIERNYNSLYWKMDTILKDLKENHIETKENQNMLGFDWKLVHIDLPSVWDFKWFNFDYFKPDSRVWENWDFESDSDNLEDKSFSIQEISELLNSFKEYLKELGVEINGKNEVNIEDNLKNILNLDYWYWLKDKNWENYRAMLNCYDGGCDFFWDKIDWEWDDWTEYTMEAWLLLNPNK